MRKPFPLSVHHALQVGFSQELFSKTKKKKKGEEEAGFRKELLHAQQISAPGERSHHRLFLELRCEFANGK